MKRTKIDLNDEKNILINMILNSLFLKQIKDICKNELFETPYAKIVSRWVWEYFERTGKSPQKDIQDIYLRKKQEVKDEEDLELLAEFLTDLSNYSETTKLNNVEYELHKALNYFKLRSLELLVEKINKSLQLKDVVNAEKQIAEYKRIEKPTGQGVDLFRDANSIRYAFEDTEEKMFKFPGVLGETLGSFCRGDFFAIMAPVKRGKTFWLFEIARYAALFGMNTIFFSLEMTQNQMVRRAWQSFTGRAHKDCEVDVPKFIDEGKRKKIILEKRKYTSLNLDSIEDKQKEYLLHTKGRLKIQTYPSGYADIHALESCLANLEYYENFVPDVIVVDYADIIKGFGRDYRNNLNEIWVRLRGWAQEKNCLVATATQTSKKAFTRDASIEDVAEDMRKLATVTKMIILNQNENEKKAGVLRVRSILDRDGHSKNKEICVLENRSIGRVIMNSELKENVVNYVGDDFII